MHGLRGLRLERRIQSGLFPASARGGGDARSRRTRDLLDREQRVYDGIKGRSGTLVALLHVGWISSRER